jgi:hypothetical protein
MGDEENMEMARGKSQYPAHPIDSTNKNWHVTKGGKESLARYDSYLAAEDHVKKLGAGHWTKHNSDMKEHEHPYWGEKK